MFRPPCGLSAYDLAEKKLGISLMGWAYMQSHTQSVVVQRNQSKDAERGHATSIGLKHVTRPRYLWD